VIYAIFKVVDPKYEAVGVVRVDLTQPNLYSTITEGEQGYAQKNFQTQLSLIKNREVLTKVVTNLEVRRLALIAESDDPLTDLYEALTVAAVPGTFLIRVSLESKDPEEAFKIVHAVIQAYVDKSNNYNQATYNALKKRLETETQKIDVKIKAATDELMKWAKKGNIQLVPRSPNSVDGKEGEASDPEIRGDHVSEDEYGKFRIDYIRTKLLLDEEEKLLKQKQEESDPAKQQAEPVDLDQTLAEADLYQRIEAEFRADPEVKALLGEIDDREKEIKRVGKIARQGGDPALNWLRQERNALEGQFKKYWDLKYDEIRQRIVAQNPAVESPGAPESTETLKEAQERVAKIRAHKDSLEKHLKDMNIEDKEARVDSINAEIARKNLDILRQRHALIDNHLKQLIFATETGQVRVEVDDPPVLPQTPTQNRRIKLMAITPIAVTFAFLGLFLIFEIKSERVSDPDALSTRVQSEVFALPPLPSAREVRKMRELENGSDQIDRFIQRLDHLRFAVCGAQKPLDTGRCVLITSAVGGEGKTTLAAQLAARCGNAGMSTLLIDADMRRASLGSLLDVADGPGLSDVLKGDLTVEEGAIPVQGGAFHLLPAGNPIDNISLVLHGSNFGILIARLREIYDLIVIDSPPVLPVPDALILGQWVDGAILASRFDVSRFPQVERARRQLDNAGITVLGTVINGMRASDSYYGHYSYARKKGSEPNS
jgi:capsular exopolysaccharide synthesis family protein